MIDVKFRLVAVATAASLMLPFGAARAADECDKMAENIKAMITKVDDKSAKTDAGKCAAVAQMLGLMRIVRVVQEECLSEGDNRIAELARVDTIIRGLATAADTQCGAPGEGR